MSSIRQGSKKTLNEAESMVGDLLPQYDSDIQNEDDLPYQKLKTSKSASQRLLSEPKISKCKKKTSLSVEQVRTKDKAISDDCSLKMNDKVMNPEAMSNQSDDRSGIFRSWQLLKFSKKVQDTMAADRMPIEKRTSQWEELMRKFSEAHKEECKSASLDIPQTPRSIKHFPTGSTYEGTWDILGMSGYGTYTFPNGVIYTGEFEDGMFQGNGELVYPDGARLRGVWAKGRMVERTLLFADGLEYSEVDWKYCRMPDRRFTIEYENGLQPGGKSYMTAEQPTRVIPPGYYDTGDGFYDPKSKIVYSADDITCIVRSPWPVEQKWIIENCRTCPEEAVGPRPELYEEWSEPQPNTEPPPPPAASSVGLRRSTSFSEDYFDKDDVFYQTLSKSRTSYASRRSSLAVRFNKRSRHFRWYAD